MRKKLIGFALILAAVILLVSCAPNESSENSADERIVLQLLTEENMGVFNKQIIYTRQVFERRNQNVDFEINRLSDDPEERRIQLDQLRVEILAGKGPDLYLLPTEVQYTVDGMHLLEPLFPDINQTMENGLFADISAYYNTDTDLNTAALNFTVMDAATIEEKRFALPLRYDYPVLYVNNNLVQKQNIPENAFAGNAEDLYTALSKQTTPEAVAFRSEFMRRFLFNFFPDLLDYENQQVLLNPQALTGLLNSYLAFQTTGKPNITGEYSCDFSAYLTDSYWGSNDCYCHFSSLEMVPYEIMFAETAGFDLTMIPLTGEEGQVVADITLYGAVDAGCAYPELAYDFLREFLTEESQWEANIEPSEMYTPAWQGYPVRTAGCFSAYSHNLLQRMCQTEWNNIDQNIVSQRTDALQQTVLTEERLSRLDACVDAARFPLNELEREILKDFNNLLYCNEMDIAALADEWTRNLEFHLLEG